MATFDQLPPEQRAILELVLQRRQSYADLADMLGMPGARVRELARAALTELSPRSASRVDPEWRGQVADYLLGQQTGPEGTATRGHLKRSEAARLWALSLLDSLDHLYPEDALPIIPEGEAAPVPERAPRERPLRKRERPLRDREPSLREPPDERPRRAERPSRPLSADAEAVVRRRRIAAAAAAAAILLFGVLVWPVGVLTGDDGDEGGDGGSAQADDQPRVLGQLLLRAQSGERGAVGIALITERDGERSLLVQARGLKPTRQGQAYEVWLFNGQQDAVSMGAQLTDRQGNYQGAGRLPEDYSKYQFLDISRENVDQNAAHSGDSVLRGRLEDLQAAGTGSGELEEPGAPDEGGEEEGGGGSPLPGG
jgi:hypothetical protein